MSDPADGRPDDDVDDEELAEMADELSDVLRELRDELKSTREAREAESVDPPATGGGAPGGGGGGGLPDIPFDLPSATDVLAFTDEKLIPAAITVLEVNIRALELLQKGIRWARPDRAGENAERVRAHAESVSRSTLQRLDTVLADLQDAASRGALPENAEAGDVITEARSLRDEIDAALASRAEAREDQELGDGDPAEDDGGPADPFGLDDQPEVDVDVESELESIKAELGKDEDDAPDDERPATADADDARERDGSGDDPGEGEVTGDDDGSEDAGEDDEPADGDGDPGEEDDDGGDPGEGVGRTNDGTDPGGS